MEVATKKKENSLNTAIRCVVLVLPTFSKTPGSWPPVGAEYRSNQGGFLQFLLNETRGPENLLLKVHSLKTNSQFALKIGPSKRPKRKRDLLPSIDIQGVYVDVSFRDGILPAWLAFLILNTPVSNDAAYCMDYWWPTKTTPPPKTPRPYPRWHFQWRCSRTSKEEIRWLSSTRKRIWADRGANGHDWIISLDCVGHVTSSWWTEFSQNHAKWVQKPVMNGVK